MKESIDLNQKGFVHTPKSFSKDTSYDYKELDRPAGVPESRFEAFRLPSMIGGQRVYPKRVP